MAAMATTAGSKQEHKASPRVPQRKAELVEVYQASEDAPMNLVSTPKTA